MASVDQVNSKTNELLVGPHDILFECPACSKSLVVDEDGEGMIVDCPQCHINVIVPPKTAKPAAAATVATLTPPPAAVPLADVEVSGDVRTRLIALGNKMKELQTQRAEINNRMASRINDINRDLVMTARLETAHQQVIAELNELIAHVTGGGSTASPAGRTRVNLRS